MSLTESVPPTTLSSEREPDLTSSTTQYPIVVSDISTVTFRTRTPISSSHSTPHPETPTLTPPPIIPSSPEPTLNSSPTPQTSEPVTSTTPTLSASTLTTSAIVGIALGPAVLVLLLLFGGLCVYRKRTARFLLRQAASRPRSLDAVPYYVAPTDLTSGRPVSVNALASPTTRSVPITQSKGALTQAEARTEELGGGGRGEEDTRRRKPALIGVPEAQSNAVTSPAPASPTLVPSSPTASIDIDPRGESTHYEPATRRAPL
ncbi:hypothetical protein BKA70DRAFT_1428444 [Coprinopsis sp. MPI-PUGE-AT-0042]|nr:hypothetical protein BKA70DRAFT_1428444 [Coprinopsis sp. MPI-PUGE-AT-0042]